MGETKVYNNYSHPRWTQNLKQMRIIHVNMNSLSPSNTMGDHNIIIIIGIIACSMMRCGWDFFSMQILLNKYAPMYVSRCRTLIKQTSSRLLTMEDTH